MKAIIIDDNIIYKNNKIRIDDLFDDSFYAYSNTESDKYYNTSYGVNEVFNNLIQYYMAIQKWIQENNPSKLDVRKADKRYKFFVSDIGKKLHIKTTGIGQFYKIIIWINFQLSVLASSFFFSYKLLMIPYKPGIKRTNKFAVVRSQASIKKFKKFTEIPQEIESVYDKKSIYRLFPKEKRLVWMFKTYINAFKTYMELKYFYQPFLGVWFKFALMDFYKNRIVYAELYKLMMDDYLSYFKGCEFYTGNNLDRYSIIEDQLCNKYHIKTYNIPHGIEYGFKFPKGFSSDVFYAHSQYAADFLNKLYGTSKYVFSEDVIKRMFDYHYEKNHEKMIIFFTEPREVNVNVEIVKGLLPKLKDKGLKLFLKLHPGDNKANYDGLDVEFITEYELSLTGNICISRKSTILLEAIYNNSMPVAIITNPKDKTMFTLFPSLNAKEIVKTYSIEELYNVIISNI